MTIADLTRHAGRFGTFTVVALDDVVLAATWDDPHDAVARIHPTLRPTAVRERSELGAITRALVAYDAGDVAALDDVAVHQHAGPFQRVVQDTLRAVPGGTTCTYAELAARAGRPGAARAAGSACARNVVALFVPCHRAIGTDGGLRGFAYGLGRKAELLAHESAASAS